MQWVRQWGKLLATGSAVGGPRTSVVVSVPSAGLWRKGIVCRFALWNVLVVLWRRKLRLVVPWLWRRGFLHRRGIVVVDTPLCKPRVGLWSTCATSGSRLVICGGKRGIMSWRLAFGVADVAAVVRPHGLSGPPPIGGLCMSAVASFPAVFFSARDKRLLHRHRDLHGSRCRYCSEPAHKIHVDRVPREAHSQRRLHALSRELAAHVRDEGGARTVRQRSGCDNPTKRWTHTENVAGLRLVRTGGLMAWPN